MTILKAGDIRQKGDEVRSLIRPVICKVQSEWEPIQLVGYPILTSDLMHAEYRRP